MNVIEKSVLIRTTKIQFETLKNIEHFLALQQILDATHVACTLFIAALLNLHPQHIQIKIHFTLWELKRKAFSYKLSGILFLLGFSIKSIPDKEKSVIAAY